jgi:hypothetical protein
MKRFLLEIVMAAWNGVEVSVHSFLTSALEGGVRSVSLIDLFTLPYAAG